jgi:hypothetical protein
MDNKKSQFATSIDKNIADDFRKTTEMWGIKMNVVLETFMRQFANGELILKFDEGQLKIEEKK